MNLSEEQKPTKLTYAKCANCDCPADKKYTKSILFYEYTFCGERCQCEGEMEIRKSYRKSCKK